MDYSFEEYVNRRGTYSSKWDGPALRPDMLFEGPIRWDDETIPLFHADMDFACAPAIVSAMHRVADHRIYGYTNCLWVPEYYEAVISWYKRRFQTEIQPQDILYADGTLAAIRAAIQAFTGLGDGVIIMSPVYGSFLGCIRGTYRKIIDCPLIRAQSGEFFIDWPALEQACSVPTNKMMILCSPANPIGRIWTADELRFIARICRQNHVLLLSDEVHADVLRMGVKHHTILEAVSDHSNIIMLSSISKAFNVAGLHCTNAIIPDERLRTIYQKAYGTGKPTPFTIAAFIAAYTEGEAWLDALRIYLDSCIDFSLDFIKKNLPFVRVNRPDATYFLWLDFEASGLEPGEIRDRIYNKANVLLQDGTEHAGAAGAYCHRMSISAPRMVIEEAFKRIAREFSDIQERI